MLFLWCTLASIPSHFMYTICFSQTNLTSHWRKHVWIMTNVYHFDGVIVFVLLVICTCAYFKRVPRLKQLLLSEKKGLFGALYKAAVIGTRLHWAVAATCCIMAVYVLFLK